MSEAKPITVVTVHGTGDTAASLDGEKWFQRGAAFTEKLRENLRARGFEATIIPHLWSGANSARGREDGADKLADLLKAMGKKGVAAHVIGHSHGGNVANEAADYLRWGKPRKQERIASITTVGTPFFKVTTPAAERFAGLVFLGITFASAGVLTLIGLVMAAALAARVMAVHEAPWQLWPTLGVLVVSLFFMFRLALAGFRRIMRPSKIQSTERAIFAVYHPNDEAIAFLKKVEFAPIEPFPRWTFLRQSRGAGIVWGVRAALVVAALGVLGLVPGVGQGLMTWIDNRFFAEAPAERLAYSDAAYIALLLIFMAPGAFAVVYLLGRFLFGVIPEFVVRGFANRLVGESLRGMAFGRDGDQRLSQVSEASHTLPTRAVALEGAVFERLQANAAEAASRLIEKYRWALFSIASESNQALSELATDAMTWDSLIHTTYFEHDEVVDLIAAHIAESEAARASSA